VERTRPPNYWFPAKRYGWGWGPPRTWQGWVVMALFFLLLAVGLFIFLPAGREVDFLLYTVVLVVLLIAVCYAKGEPPRWRWGKK
jgi:drug/metabolite transporter (DMT)-like permease